MPDRCIHFEILTVSDSIPRRLSFKLGGDVTDFWHTLISHFNKDYLYPGFCSMGLPTFASMMTCGIGSST